MFESADFFSRDSTSHDTLAELIMTGAFENHLLECKHSSLLEWIDFEVTDRDNLLCNMIVKFKNSGSEYMYHEVDLSKVLAFQVLSLQEDMSVGKCFNQEFKGQYNYTRLVWVELLIVLLGAIVGIPISAVAWC